MSDGPILDPFRFVNPNPELIISNAASYTAEENSTPTDNNQTQSPLSATAAAIADVTNGAGSYVMEVTATATTNAYQRHYLNGLTNGEIYEYKILCRQTVGVDGRFTFTNTTNSQFTAFSHTGWIEYIGEITMTSTQLQLNMWAVNPAATGSIGDKVQYKYSIKLKND